MQRFTILQKSFGFLSHHASLFQSVKRSFAGTYSDLKELPKDMTEIPTPKKVIVVAKEYCSFCENTKEFLDENDVDYEIIMADKLGITDAQKEQFLKFTGGKTYPRIFVGKTSVGGFNDMMRMYDKGKLGEVFKSEGIPFQGE